MKTKPKAYRFKINATGDGLTMDWNIPDVSEAAATKLVEAIHVAIASVIPAAHPEKEAT